MLNHGRLYICGVLATACVLTAEAAHAATYYVATNGKDTNSCSQAQSQSTPKQTLTNAVGCLAAGDTLLVRGGNYPESLTSAVPSGTSWSSKVRIANFPGETVWLRPAGGLFAMFFGHPSTPAYIEFDGINVDGSSVTAFTIKVEAGAGYNAHHIRFQNLKVIGPLNPNPGNGSTIITYSSPGNPTGAGFNEFINLDVRAAGHDSAIHQDHGFYIGSPNNLIERCNIYDFTASGVQIWNEFMASGQQSEGANNNTIRYNRIHDGQRSTMGGRGWGIVTGTASGTKIYGNVVYGVRNTASGSAGISVFSSSNSEVYNNTVSGNDPIGLDVTSYASGAIVRNNISYANGGGDYAGNGSGITVSNNLFGVDPKFVNAAARDFQLQSGSPALDAAVALSAVTSDVNGTARPQGQAYDIGAFELVSASSPAATSVPSAPTGLRVVSN